MMSFINNAIQQVVFFWQRQQEATVAWRRPNPGGRGGETCLLVPRVVRVT